MEENKKTHYRKAFDSPYLSSADIVGPTVLTIKHVRLEPDQTKKTKDKFNTAYFSEKELRPGETLKPMILNAGNSRTMKKIAGSPFIEDWNNIPVTIYVDPNVKFGRDTVEGLRIKPDSPKMQKPELLPSDPLWVNAVEAYKRDGNLDKVKEKRVISAENEKLLIAQAEQSVE